MKKWMKYLMMASMLTLAACSEEEDCSDEDTSYYGDCSPVEDMSDEEIESELTDMLEDSLED
jgi:hypothetical protein